MDQICACNYRYDTDTRVGSNESCACNYRYDTDTRVGSNERRPSHLRVMDLDQTFSGDSGQLENMLSCYVRLCEYALEALDKK
ncbi:unnamed protein product [Trichogramma brassicae]|uniref:Uncharacterized protein n=1 Tax=Trichogramma brassicae TaxID=86971 RepID=A0A6H5IUJ6_9HYME|nr:unnamed protein product [Trichogramma brassicae]